MIVAPSVNHRWCHVVVLTLLLLQLFNLAPLSAVHGLAQDRPAPNDSVPRDSQPRYAGPGCEMCLGVALAAFSAVMLTAPPSVFFLKGTRRDTLHLTFSDDHVSVFFIGGGSWERPGRGWVYSSNFEILKRGLYGGVSIEDFRFSDLGTVHFATVRTGYLVRARPGLAGGVTLGYRSARGNGVQNAIEIGLPLVMGSRKAWGRFEPTYAISSAGVSWNYRLRLEAPIGQTPFFAGFNIDVKTLRQGGAYYWNPALVLGLWPTRRGALRPNKRLKLAARVH